MSLREERRIVFDANGFCELQVDRVRGEKRRKVSRKKVVNTRVAPRVANLLTLPAECKMYRANQTRATFVIEQMPQVRTVGWTHISSEWRKSIMLRGCMRKFGLTPDSFDDKVFRLAFPFMVFVVTLHGLEIVGMHVFFRTEPLRSESDHLYYASITNYCVGDNGEGKLCTMRPKIAKGATQSTLAEGMVDLFWSSTFIGDWTERFDIYTREVPELKTIWDWQYHSRVDPSWVLRSPWTRFGQSIGDLLDGLVQIPDGHDRSAAAFSYFENAIASADEYHGETVGEAHGNLAPSPSTSVKIGKTIIRQGDLLRLAGPAVNGLEHGKSYEVEYFFEPTDEGLRFAKLTGMDNPVSLGLSTFAGFALVKKAETLKGKTFEVDGVKVGIGSRFMVNDSSDFPQLVPETEYTIEDIRVDSDGDIAVKIHGYDFFYITTGRKLLASVFIVQPKLKDDAFSCGAKSIKVGQYVRVTSASSDRLNGKVLQVSKTWEDKKNAGRFYVRFVGFPSNYILYDTSGWRIDFIDHPFQYTDEAITFGEHTLDLASLKSILVTEAGQDLPIGGVYEVLAHTQLEGDEAHPCDVGLVLAHANQPLPIIEKSTWKFDGYKAVGLTQTVGKVALARGAKLRVASDKLHGARIGEELEILCFHPQDDDPDSVQIVFTDGRIMGFIRANFEYLEEILASGERRAFSAAMIESLPGGQGKEGEDFEVGDEVLYIGGDHNTNSSFDSEETINKPAEITKRKTGMWNIHFGRRVPGSNDDGGQWIYTKFLRHVGGAAEVCYNYPFGNSIMLKKHDGSLIPLDVELDPELELRLRGYEVSQDRNEVMISIGDFVIPQKQLDHSASVRSAIGVPGMVIAYGKSWGGRRYVLVYHGKNVDAGRLGDLHDCEGMERKFRTDSFRWKITVFWAKDCERVELVQVSAGSSHLLVGSLVQIKKGIRPVDGLLGVKRSETGVVTDMSDGYVQVNFPSNAEWIGRLGEVAKIEFAPKVGDRVRVKPEVALTRLRGNVADSDVGEILELADGQLKVDFPRHPGWLGSPCDLMAAS